MKMTAGRKIRTGVSYKNWSLIQISFKSKLQARSGVWFSDSDLNFCDLCNYCLLKILCRLYLGNWYRNILLACSTVPVSSVVPVDCDRSDGLCVGGWNDPTIHSWLLHSCRKSFLHVTNCDICRVWQTWMYDVVSTSWMMKHGMWGFKVDPSVRPHGHDPRAWC